VGGPLQMVLALNGLLLTTVGGHPVARNERQAKGHKLLLISFDGFRWDYDQDVETPNLDNLAKEGVKAKYVTPPFVTMTSPSHFTTITGKSFPRSPVIPVCCVTVILGTPYWALFALGCWRFYISLD
uniref:Ectonucleotide pyrophosphatase/phosphodiesterase 7 n=1 Tax=Anolis carolinensis TaxID=28377 RepID=A0A803TN22_ANOCA